MTFRTFIPFVSRSEEVDPKEQSFGPDISAYQTIIDWLAFMWDSRRSDFMFIKSTEGYGWASSQYKKQLAATRNLGLIYSPYHFYRTGINGKTQAKWFLDNSEKGDLGAILDLEDTMFPSGASLSVVNAEVKNIMLFMDAVEAAWNIPAILYSGAWYMDPRFGDRSEFRRFSKWNANYTQDPNAKQWLPKGWTNPLFFQYTSTAVVRGMYYSIDMNVCMKTRKELYTMANRGYTPRGEFIPPRVQLKCIYGDRYIFEKPYVGSRVVGTVKQGNSIQIKQIPTGQWAETFEGWFVLAEKLYVMYV